MDKNDGNFVIINRCKDIIIEIWIVIAVLLVASFFRFYQLDKYPPGLYPDEAMNGSNALVANATGDYKIFYPENTGREGLFINIQALSIKWFGLHPWALRGVSAVFGILTVLGLYLLARELFSWPVGAVASFLLAISFWHVNFSRIGFRAIMLPFVLVFAFYFLWRGLKQFNWWYFLGPEFSVELDFYTYTAYRIAPLIAILVFINYWMFLKKTSITKTTNILVIVFGRLFTFNDHDDYCRPSNWYLFFEELGKLYATKHAIGFCSNSTTSGTRW